MWKNHATTDMIVFMRTHRISLDGSCIFVMFSTRNATHFRCIPSSSKIQFSECRELMRNIVISSVLADDQHLGLIY